MRSPPGGEWGGLSGSDGTDDSCLHSGGMSFLSTSHAQEISATGKAPIDAETIYLTRLLIVLPPLISILPLLTETLKLLRVLDSSQNAP